MKVFTLVAALPALVLAAKHDGRSRTHSQVARDLASRSQYKLVEKYQGKNFFECVPVVPRLRSAFI
jgi:hypothetical protein